MKTLGRIKTDRTKELVDKLKNLESPANLSFLLSDMSLPMKQGKGVYVEDVDGNEYLDLISGFGALSTGHSHPAVVEAVKKQAELLVHNYPLQSETRISLMEKVADLTPGPADSKTIQFGVGGSDAIEAALKQARYYSGKPGIIAFEGGYHGRTTGSLALTSYTIYRKNMGPLIYGTAHIPYAYCYRCAFGHDYPSCDLQCTRYLERKVAAPFSGIEAGAVVVEPVQGVGGMVVPPDDFLAEVRRICSKYNLVLIADEVMSGWARTGCMFACEHSNVIPDILVTAKAAASGYPISVIASKKEITENATPFSEGLTFAGNNVSCASALATLRIIEEENLILKARDRGNYFADKLKELAEQFDFIGEVRNKGLMVAMEMVKDRVTREPLPVGNMISQLIERGLITYFGGYYRNVVAFLPPLIITESEIDDAVRILKEYFLTVKLD